MFCNVVGEEEELVVTTEEGNERSKSNLSERDKVVRYYCMGIMWRGIKEGVLINSISQLNFATRIPVQVPFFFSFISGIHSPIDPFSSSHLTPSGLSLWNTFLPFSRMSP